MVWADRSCRCGLRGIRVGEASNPGPSSNEYGRFTALSEEGAAQSLVSPNVTQLDSPTPESVIEALHFDLRSDTESVRSGDPRDAVDSTDEDDEWSVAGTEEVANEVEAEVVVGVPRHRSLQAALITLDHLNVADTFKQRASVMKVVPKFLRGSYRNAMRVALEEVIVDNPTRRERGWKLFMMLPRMLLHRPPRGGLNPRHKLVHRFEMFSRGEWWDLIRASAACEQAAVGRRRRRRRPGDDLESRAARAEMLVHLGELSSARQALEGAAVAPGCNQTLTMLSDPAKRPPVLRDPIPDEVLHHVPSSLFELDEDRLLKNLRSARRGAAGGPSGMTVEHLRILLDNIRDSKLFFRACEQMAQAKVPDPIIAAIRVGRMTALRKPDGGVRGIVAGDVVRRLIARTMAQQLGKTVEAATAPYQYALSTRAGCECIAHSLQCLCEMDPTCTVLSIHGIGAFDQISRAAMLDGLLNVAGAGEALPFVLMFYGAPSVYLWEDDVGDIHTIHQGEGGEQGDALMPLLFALGQHSALDAIQENLEDGEHLFAFHDDIYTTSSPDRVGSVFALLQEHLFGYSRIRINGGKTQVAGCMRHSGAYRTGILSPSTGVERPRSA